MPARTAASDQPAAPGALVPVRAVVEGVGLGLVLFLSVATGLAPLGL